MSPDAAYTRSTPSRRTLLAVLCLGLGLTGLTACWLYCEQSSERELRALPAAERQALYRHTLGGLSSGCSNPASPHPSEFCREQAQLLLQFPECDASCRTLAQPWLPQPTR